MKSIILSTLILCSSTAFSQEIRMPDDKRDKYVTEQSREKEVKKVDDKERQAKMDQERREKEKERQRSRESSSLAPTKDEKIEADVAFCSVREIGTMDDYAGKVSIAIDPKVKMVAERLDDDMKKQLYAAMEGHRFNSGMEALGFLSSNGWTLVESNIYTVKEHVVREYLLKLDLKK